MPPERSGKAEKKTGTKPKSKSRNKRKRKNGRRESFSPYIFKVLKLMRPNQSISRGAMVVMDNFIWDIFERIAVESSHLVKYNKRRTITSREIQTAVRLLMSGELGEYAVEEGMKAMAAFAISK